MHKHFRSVIFVLVLTVLSVLGTCNFAYAQQINRIQSRCPSPYQLTKSQVSTQGNGDIIYVPCTGRSSIFTGNVDFSGAVITGAVTGSGTVNFIPRWLTSTNNLANTPLSWNGTTYNFNNTALTSTFPLNLSPVSGSGIFNVGDTASAYIALGQATGLAQVKGASGLELNSGTGSATIGDTAGAGNGTQLILDDSSNTLTFDNIVALSLAETNLFNLNRTISGGTGNVTIDKPAGTVNFAAAGADIVVTNNLVTANSLIFCTVQSLDATAVSCRVTDKTSGSFHIRVPAATGTTSVAFWVTN